jgi:dihydrofolate reductase
MRKIIFWMSVSLDGFMAGPDGELDWSLVDDELHQYFNDEVKALSALLEGRVTYELMAGFWPTADQDPDCNPIMAEFAGLWRDIPKVVFSKTLDQAGWNTTIVREVIPDEIRKLQAEPGGDMVVGGAKLAASFMAHDLIDEYRLYVHPVMIGRGQRMFQAPDVRMNLEFVETRTFGNGVVLLRYVRRG